MPSNVIITLVFTAALCLTNVNPGKLQGLNCKFENVVGRCIESRKCPQFTKNPKNSTLPFCEGENIVCCPSMERIVTPPGSPAVPTLPPPPGITSPSPPLPTVTTGSPPPPPPPPVLTTAEPSTSPSDPEIVTPGPTSATSALPIIEVTTKIMSPMSAAIATQKCEEYKHNVIKRSSISTYVFGGTESQGSEFPHMAALGYGSPSNIEWLCGGSLVSEQFVVTAAHCVNNANNHIGNVVVVRLGELDLSTTLDDADPQDFGVAQQFIHPSYTHPLQYNDIALLKLDRVANFDRHIAPICLQTTQNLPNSNFIATGWGTTDSRGTQSDTLMKVDLDYFPNAACRANYLSISPESLPYGILDESQICAGSYTQEKDTCQGDSGGPLQIRDDALYLVGITSFGKACGVPDSPAVYTRVSYFVSWIQPIVWPSA